MGNSLRDQMLKAGLVTTQDTREARAEARKQGKRKKKKSGRSLADKGSTAYRSAMAQAAKVIRDRDLNRQQEERKAERAGKAQVAQLVAAHRLETDGEIPFNFVQDGVIRRIHVTEPQRRQLTARRLAVVGFGGGFHLLPADQAEKAAQADGSVFVYVVPPDGEESDSSDPYAEHQVPDDLMW